MSLLLLLTGAEDNMSGADEILSIYSIFLARMQRKAVELPPSYEEPPSYTAAIALAQVGFLWPLFCQHHHLVQPPSYFLPPMSPCLSYNIPTMMEPTCVFKDPMSSPAESTMTLPPD